MISQEPRYAERHKILLNDLDKFLNSWKLTKREFKANANFRIQSNLIFTAVHMAFKKAENWLKRVFHKYQYPKR